MSNKLPKRFAGTFHTVEELMNLPEPDAVNPQKAREVSRDLPLRFWIETSALVAMLEESITTIEANQRNALPNAARQADVLIEQRRVWLRHMQAEGNEDTFIGMFPASAAGEEYDQEVAVIE